MQTHETEKLPPIFCFYGPQTPTTFSDQTFTTRGHGIAFCTAQQRGKELHARWVGIEGSEWFSISRAPLPQSKASCIDLGRLYRRF